MEDYNYMRDHLCIGGRIIRVTQEETETMVSIEQHDQDGNVIGHESGGLEAMSEKYSFPSLKETEFDGIQLDLGKDFFDSKEEAFKIANSFTVGQVGDWPWYIERSLYTLCEQGFQVWVWIRFVNDLTGEQIGVKEFTIKEWSTFCDRVKSEAERLQTDSEAEYFRYPLRNYDINRPKIEYLGIVDPDVSKKLEVEFAVSGDQTFCEVKRIDI